MDSKFIITHFFKLFIIGLLIITLPSFAATPVTIFTAKKIITMDPAQPETTAIAVKDKRIYSVGSLDNMRSWMKVGSYAVLFA